MIFHSARKLTASESERNRSVYSAKLMLFPSQSPEIGVYSLAVDIQIDSVDSMLLVKCNCLKLEPHRPFPRKWINYFVQLN